MDEPTCTTLIKRYIAAYNAFDIPGMLATLSTDVRFENFSGGQLTASTDDITGFEKLAEQSKALFSEREQTIADLRFDGGIAKVAIKYRGRFAVDLPDGPKAGTVIELDGRSEFEFGSGKITRIADYS